MRTYTSISDNKQPEKFFGGLLTLSQGGWIAVGGLTGMLLSSGVYMAVKSMWVAIPFAIPFLIGGAIMAFTKIHGMSIIKYHSTKAIFNKQQQFILNCRPKYMKDVKDYTGSSLSKIYNKEYKVDQLTQNTIEYYSKKKDLIEKEKRLGLLPENYGDD